MTETCCSTSTVRSTTWDPSRRCLSPWAAAPTYNVANLAAAALAAVAIGVAPAAIAAVFARFGADPADNAGRLMRFEVGGVTVLVDYAHNPAGLEGLLKVAGHLRGGRGRLGMLLGHAGNRQDADIEEVARVAAGFHPDLVVVKENEAHLRGREPGELPRIIRAALIAQGMPESSLALCTSELDAVRFALDWARPGDVLALARARRGRAQGHGRTAGGRREMQRLELRIIAGGDVRRLLPYGDCVEAVAGAMRAVSAGRTIMPLRQIMRLPGGIGALGTMPGYLADPEWFGIKLLSLFPGNPAVGLSSHLGLYMLCEARHGRPVALMDASALTAIRTAAASVVATRALAREDSRVLAIIGTGEEAGSHVEAFQAVRPFERLLVWGRNPKAAQALADRAQCLGFERVRVVASVRDALAEADVVCTVTASKDPLLHGADVRPGTHLCLVGASIRSCREVDDACVAMSRFFVDYRASAMAQAGELLHAIDEGVVTEAHVVAEIGEVLDGTVAGRRSASEVTIYKSLGVAAQDLAAASLVYRRAVELGIGTLAPI